jgi:aspartyl-tRNA(Asn)/glutamyl-tRNA(Gln) amidotransferase subunit B
LKAEGHYVPTIGLEVHAQLLTASKAFCACATAYGAAPNSNCCPVCLGLPGALPVLNGAAVEAAVRAARAFGCDVQPTSVFARKHYFYPDLPKGYQISQYDRPLATGGRVRFAGGEVGLVRLHLEEDAGKSVHDGVTAVDFNRSGVPLVEIVTRPEIRSPESAAACFSAIREVLVAIGVNDGNMEEGSLRCDANVSIARRDSSEPLGVKTEIKNINSFRYVRRAIEFEVERQVGLVSHGEPVTSETRLWDSASGRTCSMRGKEEAHDYRYFPEPDLPPLTLDPAWVEAVGRSLPELPDDKRARFVSDYGLPPYDAGVLTSSAGLASYYEAVAAASGNPKAASNWVMVEALGRLNAAGLDMSRMPVAAEALGRLIVMIDGGRITGAVAKQVFARMFDEGADPEQIVDDQRLSRLGDEETIAELVRQTLEAHPRPVAQYRAGKRQTFGFLVGQVMKASGGAADPVKVAETLRRLLE